MITGVDHVHVLARDMDETIAFYTRVLGCHMLRRVTLGPPDNRHEACFLGIGDVLLELNTPSAINPELPAGTRGPLGFAVTNMDETIAHLKVSGVEILENREGLTFSGRHAVVKDPNGILIELREWYASDGHDNLQWQPTQPNVQRTA